MRLNEEDALPVEKTHLSWDPETTRARVDGLCRNPALPDPLVLRILEHPAANVVAVMYSRAWSDELFDTLAAHPDVHSVIYLGLGIQPPTPDWGGMIADGQAYLTTKWELSTIPGIAVVITALGLSLLADGLADLLRPE